MAKIDDSVKKKVPELRFAGFAEDWEDIIKKEPVVISPLHAPIPERVNSLTGSVRYLTHMDNPEKYQYDSSNIRAYGGFDLDSALSLSTGDKRQMLREMIDFIKDNQIIHLVDFTNYCLSDNAPAGWFEILTERNTLFLKEYIKSNWQKYKSGEEMK